MSKRFKSKKKFNNKYIIIIMLIIILIIIFKNFKFKSSFNFLNKFLDNEFYKDNNIIVSTFDKYSSFSPLNLLESEFKFVKSDNTSVISLNYNESEKPLIYLYNSHQNETYSKEYLEEYNITPDILMASKMFKEKLDNLKIYTIVEEADILSYMKNHNLDHSGSYIASRVYLKEAINKYSDAYLYIDLHRDAATHDSTTTTINGLKCAKILFVIGLEYDTYESNLEVATTLNDLILNKYPALTRGIMKKKGVGVNGVYNQDLKDNVILIELGGNESNIDEINNTLDLLAEIIGDYINEKKEKN